MLASTFAFCTVLGRMIVIQPQGSEPLSIEKAVEAALANNPRVKALAFDLKAASRGVASASALANPSFTFTPGFVRVGSDEELLISQSLEINGTRSARSGIAKAQESGVRAGAISELREVVYSVKSAYVDLAKAQERRSLTADLAKNAEELDAIAKRQVELGSRAGVDRTQTSVEANRTKQQAKLAQADYESALAAFNTQLGRDINAQVIVADLKYTGPITSDVGQLTSVALSSRSEVQVSQAKQEEFRQQAKLARAEGKPDIAPQFRMESVTRPPGQGGFGIGISLPIFDYGRLRNQARQAEALEKAESLRQESVQARVKQEVTQAFTRLRAAEDVLKTFEDGMLADAKKLLDATRSGFSLGETTLITVLDAQRTYRTVQSEYIDALASHAQALAQLERATGSVSADLLKVVTQEVAKK